MKSKRDGKVSRDYIQWEMVTVPGLKDKGNVTVYPMPRDQFELWCLTKGGTGRRITTRRGNYNYIETQKQKVRIDTQSPSANLDQKPSWKRRLDAIDGDQPLGAE